LSELRRRTDEQRTTLERRSTELEINVLDLTSDLSKVNAELRDTTANYERRVETLESKLKSSNDCLQVFIYLFNRKYET